MIRLALIDDEVVILQGLRNLIPWKDMGIEIVGEAESGISGLSLIEKYKPDIVISDISMPDISGIDILKEIRKRKWKTKVIFLSGYQEFSYAKAAIRYGAEDYLLKPVSPEELSLVVERTIQSINSERSVHILKRTDSEAEALFREALAQKNSTCTAREIFRLLDQERECPGAVCCALKIVVKSSVSTEEGRNVVHFGIYEYVQKYLMSRKLGVIIRKSYNLCYFLMFMENDRKKMEKIAWNLTGEIRSNFAADVILGTGDWTDADGKQIYLYKTAGFALDLFYFVERRYIDYEKIAKDYNHSFEEYYQKEEKICQQIIRGEDPDGILPEITATVKLLGNIHYGNKNAVTNSCILFAGKLFTTLQDCGLMKEGAMDEQSDFLEEIRRKQTFQKLLALFEEHYRGVFLRIRLMGFRRESTEIMRVRQYMADHYKENITLEEIADYIGMNPSYMSVFFKKETGQNFKTYLTELRMKEAVKLLNTTNMKSYELAAAVGYRDAKQFREKFREIYGVSPQQYRKRGKI